MLRFKPGINVLDMLSRCGFTSYELRRQRLIGQSEMQRIRQGGMPSWRTLDFICKVLCYQPGELIEYVPDTEKAPQK
jgi:putative transcriptional regulator